MMGQCKGWDLLMDFVQFGIITHHINKGSKTQR
jgi:hypothetical protein